MGEKDAFSRIIFANYSFVDTDEVSMKFFKDMVDVVLSPDFRGEERIVNSSRQAGAEHLVELGIVESLEDGLSIFDAECNRRIHAERRAKRGEA